MSATIQISREELYRKVWTTPAIRLAKEFGISDVALNKTCKRLGVPRPERGHWARIAAGHKPAQAPLPPAQEGQPETVQFDVAENLKRRAGWQNPSHHTLDESGATEECPIQLVALDGDLHPLAIRTRSAFQKAKPEKDGRIELRLKELPSIHISPSLADRVTIALDVLCRTLESRGITLHQEEEGGWRSGLRFVKGPDWLRLTIEEPLIQVKREPTREDKLRPSSTWQLVSTQLAGRLAFTLDGDWRLSGRKHWSETERKPLEEVLFQVVSRMEQLFESYATERTKQEEEVRRREAERKEQTRQREEEARQREEKRKTREHEETLTNIAKARSLNLWKAAEWWKIQQECLLFIEECERRWKHDCGGNLEEGQRSWLTWARACSESMSPFFEGYPDPASDGAFDAGAIAMGDAYPKVRDIPNPIVNEQAVKAESATAETKNNPAPSQTNKPPPHGNYQTTASTPFPFWLLHRRR